MARERRAAGKAVVDAAPVRMADEMSEHEHETPPEPRRSYRQGDALRDALAALSRAPREGVTISRDVGGGYSYSVTFADADYARKVEAELAVAYPPRADDPEPLKETLTRNSKGETQIAVEGRGPVQERYESLTARYPSASGKVTNDLPPEKGRS